MTTQPRRRAVPAAYAALVASGLLAAACASGGGEASESANAAGAATAAAEKPVATGGAPVEGAFGAVSECAIEGSPWTLDTTAHGETVAANMANQGGSIDGATSTGVYTIEFGRDGSFVITNAGVSTQVRFALVDGPATYTFGFTAGGSTAQWAEVEGYDDGSVIAFTNWATTIEPALDEWDRELTNLDGTRVGYPVWELTWYSDDFAVECSDTELRIALKAGPDTMPLFFRRSA